MCGPRTAEGWSHSAACNQNAEAAAAAVQALVAASADLWAKDTAGRTPLRLALRQKRSCSRTKAASLLMAGPVDVVLADLCGAKTAIARQLLPLFIAGHLPLTEAQWARIPTPFLILGRALPAALACSPDQARQVVRRLPPSSVQRLRTFALCVARVQRHSELQRPELWPQYLPPNAVQRILTYFDQA